MREFINDTALVVFGLLAFAAALFLIGIFWVLCILSVIPLWPLIWWDKRLRARGLKPDEFYWADKFLFERRIFVKTAGRFWWEDEE